MKKTAQILLVATLAIAASGCATWDKLSTREKGAAIGAAVVVVASAAVVVVASDGSDSSTSTIVTTNTSGSLGPMSPWPWSPAAIRRRLRSPPP